MNEPYIFDEDEVDPTATLEGYYHRLRAMFPDAFHPLAKLIYGPDYDRRVLATDERLTDLFEGTREEREAAATRALEAGEWRELVDGSRLCGGSLQRFLEARRRLSDHPASWSPSFAFHQALLMGAALQEIAAEGVGGAPYLIEEWQSGALEDAVSGDG